MISLNVSLRTFVLVPPQHWLWELKSSHNVTLSAHRWCIVVGETPRSMNIPARCMHWQWWGEYHEVSHYLPQTQPYRSQRSILRWCMSCLKAMLENMHTPVEVNAPFQHTRWNQELQVGSEFLVRLDNPVGVPEHDDGKAHSFEAADVSLKNRGRMT